MQFFVLGKKVLSGERRAEACLSPKIIFLPSTESYIWDSPFFILYPFHYLLSVTSIWSSTSFGKLMASPFTFSANSSLVANVSAQI